MTSGGSAHSSCNALPAPAVICFNDSLADDAVTDCKNSSNGSRSVKDLLGAALALRTPSTTVDPAVAPPAPSFQTRKKRSYGAGAGMGSLTESLNGKHGLGGSGCPRDRLQRHRVQVAGTVRIPEAWCGEARLREWVSSCEVEEALHPPGLFVARAALISARSSMPSASSPASLAPPAPPPCKVSLRS